MVDARITAGLARALQHAGRQRDDRHLRTDGTGVAADRACQREAVHVRHMAVGDDQVERLRLPGLPCLQAVVAGVYLQPQFAQALLQQLQVGRMVFDNQHPRRRQRRCRPS
jgi:hypothetical protein